MTSRRGAGRRHSGSVYLLVLGLSVMLTVLGIATLSAGRIGMRSMSASRDWMKAQALANSAAEHAMLQISRHSDWRSLYSGQTVHQSLGDGMFSWRLVDETDGSLNNGDSDPFVILATGTVGPASYTLRVQMSGSSGNVLVSGMTVATTITLSSGAEVDSYDSSLGDYGGSNAGAEATVRTNSTSDGAVAMGANSTVRGSVQVGPGGNPDDVLSMHNNSEVTGTITAMPEEVAMPTVSAPTDLGPSTGDMSLSSKATQLVTGDLHVGKLSLKSKSTLQISGDVTIWAEGDLSIASNACIQVLSGSSLTLYVSGSMSIASNGSTRNDTSDVSNITFIGLGSGAVSLTSNSTFEGVIIAPNSSITLASNAQIFGAVVARDMSLSSNAEFHEDRHITSQADKVILGEGGVTAPKPSAWGRVVE
ncbi:MAG: hypothetical protein BIFFINMI_02794 [Phycisphaerae bacterium]|nr:hypothetical protein [Phycisphaerae bacterium]